MSAKWSWRGRPALILGAAAIAGIALGVYFSLALYGKNQPEIASACTDTPALAARVDPFAKGEVAAFRTTQAPEYLADIAFKAPDGGDLSLKSFVGKAVLLNLWATWCVPCRTEMPALDRLEAEMGGDKFTVAAVNIDLNNPERAREFLKEIGVERLAFYSDPSSKLFLDLKRRGLAFGLPVTLLIDGKGCRIGSIEGPAAWDSDEAKALIAAATGAG
jgi:thiol-disulfide isomerase/thioredoxin